MPTSPDTRIITPHLLADWALPAVAEGKESRGTVLVVGGARFTPGAVLLSGVAALRAGAGRLQLAATESTAAALSIAVPEAMVVGLPETDDGSVRGEVPDRVLDLAAEASVVVIGPGLDDLDETAALMSHVLEAIGDETTVVLDAYGLGALSHDVELITGCADRCVLTPNTIEAAHLLGRDLDGDLDVEALRVAEKYGTAVSLYGHVASPDGRVWREESADVGLGTSGSGDVSAGIVAGLLARGTEPAQAACWAAHVHAMAGRRLGNRFGRVGYLARELVAEVPATIASL